MTLFIVGGNRKHEDEPLKSLILHLKKINLNFVLITDKIHLYKECKNFKDLKEFLKKYKIKYYLFNNINLEYIRLNNLIKEKIGLEYRVSENILFRTGYNSHNRLSYGLGIDLNIINLNYSSLNSESLGNSHQIRVLIKLGN